MRLAHPLLAGAILAACACTSSNPTSPSTGASLNVMIKDSPFSDAKALLVTFSEVSAHASGGDFMRVPFAAAPGASSGPTSRTCDLKKLTTAQDVLGTGSLAAGHYTQVRLIVASAVIYFDNASTGAACAPAIAAPAGRNAAVDIPSGEVRLNREFDLTAPGGKTILLDFNGDQSVRETGNGRFMMTPVIAIVSVQ
jgi:hypothetical protein